jgi:hypothetical protein
MARAGKHRANTRTTRYAQCAMHPRAQRTSMVLAIPLAASYIVVTVIDTDNATRGNDMQRNTRSWHIARANELCKQIEASNTRPTELLAEFDKSVTWLEKYAPDLDLSAHVMFPANW